MTDVLRMIDNAVEQRCACGCETVLAPDGPSAWYATPECERRAQIWRSGDAARWTPNLEREDEVEPDHSGELAYERISGRRTPDGPIQPTRVWIDGQAVTDYFIGPVFADDVDLSGYVTSLGGESVDRAMSLASWSETSSPMETTRYGPEDWRERVAGLRDFQFTVSGIFDSSVRPEDYWPAEPAPERVQPGGIVSAVAPGAEAPADIIAEIRQAHERLMQSPQRVIASRADAEQLEQMAGFPVEVIVSDLVPEGQVYVYNPPRFDDVSFAPVEPLSYHDNLLRFRTEARLACSRLGPTFSPLLDGLAQAFGAVIDAHRKLKDFHKRARMRYLRLDYRQRQLARRRRRR